MQIRNVATSLTVVPLIVFSAHAAHAGDPDEPRTVRHHPSSEFEIATIHVEQNATDGDTEIVIVAKPDSDKGLKKVSVWSPNWRRVVKADTLNRVGGMREFVFESPEPPGDVILASYPEGEYSFFGRTPDGERFAGVALLSHQLPGLPTILSPAQDAVVSADALTIEWSQVPEAAQFLLEFENESADPEQTFLVNLPAGTSSFDIPTSLLVPGADYQVAVAAVADNGNVVSVEVQFTTAD